MLKALITTLILISVAHPVCAQNSAPAAFRSTEYPLPRYVSVHSDKAYVRSGPGHKYPVQWVYKKEGLPVEIILEFENWRKIKDIDGSTGWMHQALLSGRRTAIITADGLAALYEKPESGSRIRANFEKGVLVHVASCDADWCNVEASGYTGWIEKTALWGVYAREKFD